MTEFVFNPLLANNLSVYIPHVFLNITEERIKYIFHTLELGDVSSVDFIRKQGKYGNNFHAAYIHFNYWYNTISSRNLQERILNPTKEARIVYDDPWFWLVLENNSFKKTPPNAPMKAPRNNSEYEYIWNTDIEPVNLFVSDFGETEQDTSFNINMTNSSYVHQLENQIQTLKQERDHATEQTNMLRRENNELNNKIVDMENDYWLLTQKCEIAEREYKRIAQAYNNLNDEFKGVTYQLEEEWKNIQHDMESEIAQLNRDIEYWRTEYECKDGEIIYLRGIIGDDY
jgi:archaellum component FlaC